ncbi:Cof-type HAD-IIB family hydrolase [Microbacterium aurum]
MSAKTTAGRRAIFLDVDGTLMQDGHDVPPSAVDAIRAARARGHLVFLSTGRGIAEIQGALWDLGFDGAVSNGGAFAAVGDEIVAGTLFSPGDVARLQEYLERTGIHGYFQSYDQLFATPALPALMAAKVEGTGLPMKVFYDPAHFDPAQIAKLVFVTEDPAARAIADLGADFAVVGGTIPLPGWASGEVAPAGVQKGAAIEAILAHLGIDAADAIGIGDNWNDAEMFEVCGTAIAMGNAVDGVKALADQVTTAIDDDGILRAFAANGLI